MCTCSQSPSNNASAPTLRARQSRPVRARHGTDLIAALYWCGRVLAHAAIDECAAAHGELRKYAQLRIIAYYLYYYCINYVAVPPKCGTVEDPCSCPSLRAAVGSAHVRRGRRSFPPVLLLNMFRRTKSNFEHMPQVELALIGRIRDDGVGIVADDRLIDDARLFAARHNLHCDKVKIGLQRKKVFVLA